MIFEQLICLCLLFAIVASQAVFETRLRQLSIALPLMCCAADMLSVPSRKQVVLVGEKGSAEFQDMVAATFSSYDPNRTVSGDCSEVKLFNFGCLLSANHAYILGHSMFPCHSRVCTSFAHKDLMLIGRFLVNLSDCFAFVLIHVRSRYRCYSFRSIHSCMHNFFWS